MSVDRAIALLACSLCLGAVASADDEQLPEADFLEYLGMWSESDEEWLIHEETQDKNADERSDPVPEGEASPENEDES